LYLRLEQVQEIQQVRVDRIDFVGAMIAQDLIDFLLPVSQVVTLGPVNSRGIFSGVGIMKTQFAFMPAFCLQRQR